MINLQLSYMILRKENTDEKARLSKLGRVFYGHRSFINRTKQGSQYQCGSLYCQ